MSRERRWLVQGPWEERDQRNRSRWRVRERSPEGARESFTFASKAEAQGYADKRRRDLLGEIPVSEALDRYKDHLEAKGNKASSVGNTIARLRGWLPADRLVCRLSPAMLKRSYDKRVQQVAADTHRNELAEVKTFCRWLAAEGYLAASPAECVTGKGRRRRGKAQLRRNEAQLFLAKALQLARAKKRGHEGALGAACALLLGLRSEEIRTLQVRDVDAAPDGVWLWVAEQSGKTDAARRRVEVPGELAELLVRQGGERKPAEWLFPAKTSTKYRTATWLRKAVARVCNAAQVPVVSAHGLRGTHATLAEDAGVSGHLVAAQLGHVDHRVTERHYTEAGTTARARARRAGIRLVQKDEDRGTLSPKSGPTALEGNG